MSYVPELEAILLEYDTSERGKAEKDEFGMETAFERLHMTLSDWNYDARRKGWEKASIDIAEVTKMYDHTGRVG